MYKVITETKGKKTIILDIVNEATGEIYEPKFLGYTCPNDYLNDNVIGVEPMTAKEPLNDEELEKMLTSSDYIAEEKLDGTRCTMHLLEGANRLFSRRISKKTDWYAENTDSVPHLRDFETPKEYYNTILDGEMRIDGREFKEVSSTLNCKYDEAILRQTELGYITFHAFDIIYFKGVYVAKLPLIKRKALLKQIVEALDCDYVVEEFYTEDNVVVKIDNDLLTKYHKGELEAYQELTQAITVNIEEDYEPFHIEIDKRTWYEYILAKGGEGIMLKDKNGTYKHTRGREYTKMKKFDTWDVVILDFVAPTRDYTGKELNNPEATWDYWYDAEDDSRIVEGTITMCEADKDGLLPCTKHYAMDWIGTVKFGVEITADELAKWQKTNKDKKPELIGRHLVVGECSGMNEETREYMTKNRDSLIHTVIEVGANEILKTGKLRHPRFIRFREDKEAERCTWKDHLR